MKFFVELGTSIHDVFTQMAMDEALLDHFAGAFESSPDEYCLQRIYEIDSPSITFGYFQKFPQLVKGDSRKCTRRITGGGLVEHSKDLIIALVFKPLHIKNVTEIYQKIHVLIQSELEKIVNECPQLSSFHVPHTYVKNDRFNCFKNPVQHDLMQGEMKILGGAIARRKNYLLYQGSLQFNGIINEKTRNTIKEKMCISFFKPDEMVHHSIFDFISTEKLALYKSKYESEAWQLKRT